jgi:streptomycin 6-kinase
LTDAAGIAERLIISQSESIVLHGDIHHKNILESSTKGWLAIDPKGLVGERTYDFANVFYNPDDQPELVESQDRILRTCSLFSLRFGIDPKRILEFAFAYGALSACWAMDDRLNPERRLRIAGLIRDVLAHGRNIE